MKPCPSCKGEVGIHGHSYYPTGDIADPPVHTFFIQCRDRFRCGVRGPRKETRELAEQAWDSQIAGKKS